MWTNFESLPEDSRVWIFTIQENISIDQKSSLEKELSNFIEEWTSHSKILTASAKIYENRFIIICLDERQYGASGCSIDKLMRFIQNMESRTGLTLLLKNKVVIRTNNSMQLLSIPELKQRVASGHISDKSEYYDTMIDTKQQLEHQWVKPLREGWLSKKINS